MSLNDPRKLLSLLALASDELGSTLSYEETLQQACAVPVPLLSEWCALFVMDEKISKLSFEKSFHHVRTSHTALQNYFETRGDSFTRRPSVMRCLRQGEAVQEENESDAVLGNYLLHLPLLQRSEVIGFMTLGSKTLFSKEDMQIGAEILHRAASAIDNARLYQRACQAEAELIQAKKAAEEASNAKTQFLANMSHEIRSPIGAILGFADLLMQPSHTECERLEWGHRIKHNGQHLLRLINDILNLSKVESGSITVESNPVQLMRFIDELELLLAVQARMKNLELSFYLDSPVPTEFLTDATRLQQILTNVIGNALKFTESGSVKVGAGFMKKSKILYFDVKDTGPGLTEKQAAQLFRPFAQADTEHAKKFGGTGLGLALSIKLARLLGGDLELVTSTPGQGSHFRITIKPKFINQIKYISERSDQRILFQAESAAKNQTLPLKDCKVLVVDDTIDNQYLMKIILSAKGAEVSVAESGEDALRQCTTSTFDVILMDIQMPGKDGYETTQDLRAKGINTPVVAFTAHALPEERAKSLQAGCDAHVTKPVDQNELLQVLLALLKTRKDS